jgi:hypothetical protein
MAPREIPMGESHREEVILGLDREQWLVRGEKEG